MPIVGLAYKGQGYLVKVYSNDLDRVVEEKDTLSLASLRKYLMKKAEEEKDGRNILFPLARRNIPDDYNTIDNGHYELYLNSILRETGYIFYEKHPRAIDQEKAREEREQKLSKLRKRRDKRFRR
jgi:hypothetical protein